MREFYLNDGGIIQYYLPEDIQNENDSNVKDFLSNVQNMINHISDILSIPAPYLSIANSITLRNSNDGSISKMAAMTYHTGDFPDLNNSVLQIALDLFDEAYSTGVIAHELRHIYQKIYKPEILKKYAQGYTESLYDSAEIDADAFGIWYLKTCPGGSFTKAAEILCPEELITDPDAVNIRIEKAKEIEVELVQLKLKNKSIIHKLKKYIISKLGGKKNE